jgi:hypothetical protein
VIATGLRMWYRMSMAQVIHPEPEQVYVESLQWRREDLQTKLAAVGFQVAALTREEAELRLQLRAVDQLLAAEGASSPEGGGSVHLATENNDVPVSVGGDRQSGADASPDFSAWGPKARAIYAAAAHAIGDAAVPLHYRVLAEEVQKSVPLSGVDPGATLIAHLHRAQDIFPRVGRGIYGLRGMVAASEVASRNSTPVRRRRKTRRRTK